jgi:hypothetical protein
MLRVRPSVGVRQLPTLGGPDGFIVAMAGEKVRPGFAVATVSA